MCLCVERAPSPASIADERARWELLFKAAVQLPILRAHLLR